MHLLFQNAGRRIELDELLEPLREIAGLLDELPARGLLGTLTGIDRSRRRLEKKLASGITILSDEHNPSIMGHGQEHRGAWMPQDFALDFHARRLHDTIHFERHESPFEDTSALEEPRFAVATHVRDSNTRSCLVHSMKMNALLLWLLAASSPALAELEEQGRSHLYNLDYEDARTVFSSLGERAPTSPVGPYYGATTIWMEEFTRRGGMTGSTFRTGRYWSDNGHEPPTAELDREFKELVAEAVRRADATLAQEPENADALYFRGAAEGVLSAYLAMIERSYYSSYKAGKRAKKYHERLLEVDPEYADACLLPGIYEYTVATLPRTLRFIGFLMGISGSREKGLELVRKAVESGDRTRWVARLSLSVMEQREKKYRRSLAVLRELETAFPKNPLFPFERGSVHLLRKDWSAARRAFDEVWRTQAAGKPNFDAVEPSLVLLKIAESYLFAKNFRRANDNLRRALEVPDIPDRIKAIIFLRRGMASDATGRRDRARADYRRTLTLNVDNLTNKRANRYLRKPYGLP